MQNSRVNVRRNADQLPLSGGGVVKYLPVVTLDMETNKIAKMMHAHGYTSEML
jgi:hypothetical protein